MIKFRNGTNGDSAAIALLHARSWQLNYAGIFNKDYLKYKVVEDRTQVWQEQLRHVVPNRHVILAENSEKIIGFACVVLDKDTNWGALLDNLHVDHEMKRKGLGQALMKRAAQWVQQKDPKSYLYLWVLEDNLAAVHFYEKLGGERMERVLDELPGGGTACVYRYVWKDLNQLTC